VARATISERRLGLRRYLLTAPDRRWRGLGLSELRSEFRLKEDQVSAVFDELRTAGYLQASPELLSGECGSVGEFRVLPKGKKYLKMMPTDAVRPVLEVLDGVWPRKPSKFHRETVWS